VVYLVLTSYTQNGFLSASKYSYPTFQQNQPIQKEPRREAIRFPVIPSAHCARCAVAHRQKKSPDRTIEDATFYGWEGNNFLDKAALSKKAAEVYCSLDKEWTKQREAVRKKICQYVKCDKWTNVIPSHRQEERAAALITKYGEKKPIDLQLQKEMYWLLTDQIIPSRYNFHAEITEKHEQDWEKINLSKLYIQACMESF
jgi:hypothetical protein